MDGRYHGQDVTVVRPARQGDEGFSAGGGDQVIIRFKDGSQRTVAKSAVLQQEPGGIAGSAGSPGPGERRPMAAKAAVHAIEDTGRTGGDHQTTNNNSAGSGAPGFEPAGGHPEAEASATATTEAAKALKDAPARQAGPIGPGAGQPPSRATGARTAEIRDREARGGRTIGG